MKKIYFLFYAAICAFTVQAQIIDDNFESYDLGQLGDANTSVWSVWSGTPSGPSAEDLIISDVQTASGDKAGFIGAGAGPQDVMLLLGNLTSGEFTLTFNMFIPTGKTAYFNIQGETQNGGAGAGGGGVFNSPNVVFNNTQSANGAPGLGGFYPTVGDANPTVSWAYPENEWFEISILFDVTGSIYTMIIDGETIEAQIFDADGTLGAIDFFAIDANNEYFIDDVIFEEGILSTEDFAISDLNVYPNPVKDILNVTTSKNISTIQVYDTLGKMVMQTNPNTVTASIDMSRLQTGIYFVKVSSNEGLTDTVKILR